jgi:hypothetical protein
MEVDLMRVSAHVHERQKTHLGKPIRLRHLWNFCLSSRRSSPRSQIIYQGADASSSNQRSVSPLTAISRERRQRLADSFEALRRRDRACLSAWVSGLSNVKYMRPHQNFQCEQLCSAMDACARMMLLPFTLHFRCMLTSWGEEFRVE